MLSLCEGELSVPFWYGMRLSGQRLTERHQLQSAPTWFIQLLKRFFSELIQTKPDHLSAIRAKA